MTAEGLSWISAFSRSTISSDSHLQQEKWDLSNRNLPDFGSAGGVWRANGAVPQAGCGGAGGHGVCARAAERPGLGLQREYGGTDGNGNTVTSGNRVLLLNKTRWRNTHAGRSVAVHEQLGARAPICCGPHGAARCVRHPLPAQAPRKRGAPTRAVPGRRHALSPQDGPGASAPRPPGFHVLGQDCGLGPLPPARSLNPGPGTALELRPCRVLPSVSADAAWRNPIPPLTPGLRTAPRGH